jgi:cell division protease FtsH
MAMRYGMGDDELGLVSYGEKQGSVFLGVDPSASRNYSEAIAKQIDAFVRQTINEQYERAKVMLQKHRKKLDDLVEVLLKQETMPVEEFLKIFEGAPAKAAD